MKTQLVTVFLKYPQAKKLKELGFVEPCFSFYNEDYPENGPIGIGKPLNYNNFEFNKTWRSSNVDDIVSAPMYWQVIDWFETYDIYIYAFRYDGKWKWKIDIGKHGADFSFEEFKSKYEALDAAIEKSFTYLKTRL